MNSDSMVQGIVALLAMPAFWLTWWFNLSVAVVVLGAAITFYRVRVNALIDQRSRLQSQLQEQIELLGYANTREQKVRELAEASNRKKSQLLAMISHEIRTPMNGVIGMTTLLGETPLNAEQKEYVDTIQNCGESLLTVINDILLQDILEYSKVESGKELEPRDFDLRNSIEEVLDVFAVQAGKTGVDLVYEMDRNVPQQIIGDPLRLRQILMNLVENAVKFTSRGEIFVGVHLIEANKENRLKLAFEVSDSGTGMDEVKKGAILKQIANTNAAAAGESKGFGLVFSKRIVELMGGTMDIESTPGKGTTVRFTISTWASLHSIRAHMHPEMVGLEGKKILIVDDNPVSRRAIKNQLEQWKLFPVQAVSGKQALDILSREPHFDLVIADRDMPGMDGIELTLKIKQMMPALPVISLVHAGDERSKQHPELFSLVLQKPLRQHLLSQHLVNGLHHQVQAARVQAQTTHQLSVHFSEQFPLRILIAEDDLINQQLATKILAKLGYTPDVVSNGKEVLEIVSQNKYDLILMDVQMPEMDGFEATRMIRLCLSVQPVIVATTANSMQGDREECLKAGMDDYISKPIHLAELIGLLEKWALLIREKKQVL